MDITANSFFFAGVFVPTIIDFMVFLMVRMPGGANYFMWTMACCVQIAAAKLLLVHNKRKVISLQE